jgi:SAM-dependent methyltransferase
MAKQAWYRDWFNSPYYHLLYQHRDESEAEQFIATLMGHLHLPNGSFVLDVACGKGRHSVALAEMGYEVTGIDLSAASIAEARLQEHSHLHFYQHDMRSSFRINYYDLVLNCFTSFGYFKTRREHDNAIRTMALSLKPQGQLVIDFLNVPFAAKRLEKSQVVERNEVQFHVTKWQDEHHFYKQIQITEKGKHQLRHLHTERVAKFSLGDFNEMLGDQGLQINAVFGDYQLSPYQLQTSPRMVILAGKRQVG